MSSPAQDLQSLPLQRKLILGAGLVLLVASFLPWYKASAFGVSATLSGWHQLGTIAWLLLIVTLVVEGGRVAKLVPLGDRQGDLAVTGLGAGTVLFAVIFVLQRITGDLGVGFGFILGVIALIAFAYGVFLLFKASDGQAALKDLQAQAEARRRQDPPAPGA